MAIDDGSLRPKQLLEGDFFILSFAYQAANLPVVNCHNHPEWFSLAPLVGI